MFKKSWGGGTSRGKSGLRRKFSAEQSVKTGNFGDFTAKPGKSGWREILCWAMQTQLRGAAHVCCNAVLAGIFRKTPQPVIMRCCLGIFGTKKASSLGKFKETKHEINSAVPLFLPQKLRPLCARPTTRLPANGGTPFAPTDRRAVFSGLLPGQFQHAPLPPCTSRRLSESGSRAYLPRSLHLM